MLEKGVVSELLPDNKIKITLSNQACGQCKSCSGHGAPRSIILNNKFNKQVGDSVSLEIPAKYYLQTVSLVFVMPVVALVLVLGFIPKIEIALAVFGLICLMLIFFNRKCDKNLDEICRIIG